MVKKVPNPETHTQPEAENSERPKGTVRDSASQIWLAGLGAFTKAQEEGGKVFEALVKEGQSIQRKTQATAEEKLSQAVGKMTSLATDMSSRSSGQWDKLEGIFEDRVSRALSKLGIPSAADIAALNARVDELSATVSSLKAKPDSAARRPAAPLRKRTASRKV